MSHGKNRGLEASFPQSFIMQLSQQFLVRLPSALELSLKYLVSLNCLLYDCRSLTLVVINI